MIDKDRAIQMLCAGEKMLEIADGASTAWDSVKAGKTFSQLAIKTAVGAEKVQKGGALATFTILTTIMGIIFVPAVIRMRKQGD